jgi:hypothetical protein
MMVGVLRGLGCVQGGQGITSFTQQARAHHSGLVTLGWLQKLIARKTITAFAPCSLHRLGTRAAIALHDPFDSSFENLHQVITLVNGRFRQLIPIEVLHDLLGDD